MAIASGCHHSDNTQNIKKTIKFQISINKIDINKLNISILLNFYSKLKKTDKTGIYFAQSYIKMVAERCYNSVLLSFDFYEIKATTTTTSRITGGNYVP